MFMRRPRRSPLRRLRIGLLPLPGRAIDLAVLVAVLTVVVAGAVTAALPRLGRTADARDVPREDR